MEGNMRTSRFFALLALVCTVLHLVGYPAGIPLLAAAVLLLCLAMLT